MTSNIAIDCVLLEKCNLNCLHCFQNHTSNIVNENYIRNLPSLVKNTIRVEVEKKNPDLIMLSMRGGELFLDCFPDSLIESYAYLVKEVRHFVAQSYPDKEMTVHIMSNGVYKKVDRVIEFLKEVGGKITLSFDAFGRYQNESQYNLFYSSYKRFKDEGLIKNIAITLTKQSIEKYISDASILRQFDGSEIDLNYYVPTAKEGSVPSDKDLFDFYKAMVDNEFYNCIYVRNLLENHRNGNKISISCNCANTTVIFNNKAYRTCNIYVPDLDLRDFYGDCKFCEQDAVKVITHKGLKKRNCYLCPYFGNCTYYCWMMLCYKGYEMGECPHQKIHQYVNHNPRIIENYIKWLNQ